GRSKGTVRHWLRRYGLTTAAAQRASKARVAKGEGRAVVMLSCIHHGETEFVIDGAGCYRCRRCRVERVVRRRQKVKGILVSEAGGKCLLCGYDRCPAALQFHHR